LEAAKLFLPRQLWTTVEQEREMISCFPLQLSKQLPLYTPHSRPAKRADTFFGQPIWFGCLSVYFPTS
jgi:hypothetical protein